MNIQSFSNSLLNPQRGDPVRELRNDARPVNTQNDKTEAVRQVSAIEVVPADVSDAEFQAQQLADERQQRQGQTTESQQFLNTQQLDGEQRLGRFINIEV